MTNTACSISQGFYSLPAIFWWPGTIQPDVITELGSTLDILETFCHGMRLGTVMTGHCHLKKIPLFGPKGIGWLLGNESIQCENPSHEKKGDNEKETRQIINLYKCFPIRCIEYVQKYDIL